MMELSEKGHQEAVSVLQEDIEQLKKQ